MTAAEEALLRLAQEVAAARGQRVDETLAQAECARQGKAEPAPTIARTATVSAPLPSRPLLEMATLATSSKGNATVVRAGATAVLVDAGISARRLTQGLQGLGIAPETLAGIFLTHEHRDHVAGLANFLKRYDVPVYANRATWAALGDVAVTYARRLMPLREEMCVGDLVVRRFAISHDAADPSGFTFTAGCAKGAVCTDLGTVTPEVEAALDAADMLVLEANHDPDMVRFGPYAGYLKQRILSNRGHLANAQAGRLLTRLYRGRPLQLIWAHRSETNNDVHTIDDTVAGELAREDIVIRRERIRWQHGRPDGTVRMSMTK